MSVWIVLAVLGLLLMMGLLRERFEATASIKGLPYDDAEKRRIYGMAKTADQKILLDKAIADNPTKNPNTPADTTFLETAAGGYIAPAVGDFFETVFKSATTPITAANIDTFTSNYRGTFPAIEKQVLTTYFVGQQGIGTAMASGYADVLKGLGQNVGYLRDSPLPVAAAAAGGTGAVAGAAAGGTGAGDASAAGGTAPGADTPTDETAEPTPSTTNTTGGSSVSTYAPTGGSTDNKNVWGPAWAGADESTSGRRGDSTKTTTYPVLLGGYGGGAGTPERTRIDGVGVTNASGSGITLPPVGTTGSEPNSQFLPNARVPATTDFSGDPYRLAKTYSAASHSSKTDPVPFLTDFSAFFK
jgi:hypothetical protein